MEGFEPTTHRLRSDRSTTELHRHCQLIIITYIQLSPLAISY